MMSFPYLRSVPPPPSLQELQVHQPAQPYFLPFVPNCGPPRQSGQSMTFSRMKARASWLFIRDDDVEDTSVVFKFQIILMDEATSEAIPGAVAGAGNLQHLTIITSTRMRPMVPSLPNQ